jgi:GT2 family glycosyltransferase
MEAQDQKRSRYSIVRNELDLSIITVNYNVKEFLQNLIHSIHKAAQNLSYEIIIVDNASSDGSAEFITDKFPEVNLIANKENLGFGKANNQGLKIAGGNYILLINPDALDIVLQSDRAEQSLPEFQSVRQV